MYKHGSGYKQLKLNVVYTMFSFQTVSQNFLSDNQFEA